MPTEPAWRWNPAPWLSYASGTGSRNPANNDREGYCGSYLAGRVVRTSGTRNSTNPLLCGRAVLCQQLRNDLAVHIRQAAIDAIVSNG